MLIKFDQTNNIQLICWGLNTRKFYVLLNKEAGLQAFEPSEHRNRMIIVDSSMFGYHGYIVLCVYRYEWAQ